MNFVSNVLDAIPVVGHVKGAIHYATGDVEGGDKAMYQSTRTSAVVAGGVIGGALGGPAGAIGGAVYAGSATDVAASAAFNKPQGIVKHCKNVGDDIVNGRNPTKSLVQTGVHVGLDAVGGMGMGGVSSAAAQGVGKRIAAKEAAKFTFRKAFETAVNTTVQRVVMQTAVVAERAAIETMEQEKQAEKDADRRKQEEQAKKDADRRKQEHAKSDDGRKSEREATEKGNNEKADRGTNKNASKSGKDTGSGSGSQPPKENKDGEKKDSCENPGQFSDILKLLEKILQSVCKKENQEKFYEVFKKLGRAQKNTLKTLFNQLNYFQTTETVLKLVIQIFEENFPSDFTFTNFLSLMEFVKSYINNNIEERGMIYLATEATSLAKPFQQLQTYLINLVAKDFYFLRDTIDTFIKIRAEIESEIAKKPVNPHFRDLFSAVYHYCKHRIVPGDGILSVGEYYDWIRLLLAKIKDTVKFSDLSDSQNQRKITYELYVGAFRRRIRIIITIQGNRMSLLTCYVVDVPSDDTDKEGDVFIDGEWFMNLREPES